jgi:hypothetical protein
MLGGNEKVGGTDLSPFQGNLKPIAVWARGMCATKGRAWREWRDGGERVDTKHRCRAAGRVAARNHGARQTRSQKNPIEDRSKTSAHTLVHRLRRNAGRCKRRL